MAWPQARHDLIIRGLAERQRKKQERERAEKELRELRSVKSKFYLDLEAETYLNNAADLLIKEYPNLSPQRKERVIEELTSMIGKNGMPDKPVKILLRELVNKALGEW